MYKQLINTGVHDGLSFQEKNKIRIFNNSCLIISLMMIAYTITGYVMGYHFSCALTGAEFFILTGGVMLNHFGMYKASFHIEMITGMLFLFGISMVFGNTAENQMFFFFFPVVSIIFFDKYSLITFYFILSMLLLSLTQFFFRYYEPYYPHAPINDVFGIINPIFTGLLIFLGVRLFKVENLEFNKKINLQKKLLEEKNKDITDSITYAQRIQKALMASDSLLNKNLPEHFVLYKPKDIVSGDFYWAEKCGNKFLIATCDCTGHGVPGAFMSLLGVSFLNKITIEEKIIQPDLIFNGLRDDIIKALNPEGNLEEGKDGMDAVLCSFDFQKMEMEFACANNPLWILRNNQWQIFKPDKFPIGMQGEIKPFTFQKFQLQKGDMIYSFTDGYADQFGGDRGKKFKYKNIQQLFLNNSSKSMSEQKMILNDTMEQWKGNLEQIDDILIIGIRV